jgi:hypothetical protein
MKFAELVQWFRPVAMSAVVRPVSVLAEAKKGRKVMIMIVWNCMLDGC